MTIAKVMPSSMRQLAHRRLSPTRDRHERRPDQLLPDNDFGAVDAIEVVCCIRDVTFSLNGRTADVAAITAISTTV